LQIIYFVQQLLYCNIDIIYTQVKAAPNLERLNQKTFLIN